MTHCSQSLFRRITGGIDAAHGIHIMHCPRCCRNRPHKRTERAGMEIYACRHPGCGYVQAYRLRPEFETTEDEK
jgi:hypothetical protein